jgi:hypothetical protein
MDLRHALKQIHAGLTCMTPEALDRLIATLEEELALARTIRAMQSVVLQRDNALGDQLAAEDAFVPATDMDRQDQQKASSIRPPGEVTQKLTEYFRAYGTTPYPVVLRHFRELGFDGRAICGALRHGKQFQCDSEKRWGLAPVAVAPSPAEHAA